jgi:two-component system, OmpR family, sensor histidine kinase KdpD
MPRGELRIHIGVAAGAGTTYAMLDEAVRRQARGTDILVACVTTHHRPATVAKLAELTGQSCPSAATALDVSAVVGRKPSAVVIDELAHDNPAGSTHVHRWQDVDAILESGIDVITTLTVQHIESLADPVQRIVGRAPKEQVPDSFLRRADQIELVDITPEAIRRRIAHGNVFGRDDLDPARSELFNSAAFAQLRALLLFWMADHLADASSDGAAHPTEAREHVVVAVTGAPDGDAVIRRAARLARRSRAGLVGVHVRTSVDNTLPDVPASPRALLLALGGRFHEIEGDDVATSLLAFAEAEGATQLVLGTSGDRRFTDPRRGSVVDQIIRRTPPVDVHVISHGKAGVAQRSRQWRWAPAALSHRRRVIGLVGGAVAMAALTALLVLTRGSISVSTGLSLYLLAVVSIAAVGGRLPGVAAAVAAPLLANWFLIEPIHTFRVSDGEEAIALVVFVSVAVIVSSFVSVAARRATEAERARREASTLAALAGSSGPDTLQSITDLLRRTFELEGVAVLQTEGPTTTVVATSGDRTPVSADGADFHEPIGPGVFVAAHGPTLTADDHRVLRAFLQQLAKAFEQHRITAVAAEADALGRADELRTAILRAVSHDLRSPLAGIKASVSSLRQRDVQWPDDVRNDFLASIEDETDRLTAIISNLLDMSRLQAGVVRPALRPVALEEVVPAALHSLGSRAAEVDVQLFTGLADVSADPALLERIVANLVTNAIEWSPPQDRVRVTAHQRDNDVQLHVIDHGPGIHPKDRSTVRRPFHRLVDNARHSGVGLGLAIADGLTVAMGGSLDLRDTPGGGLTVVVTLPIAS